MYAVTDTNGQDATTASHHYGVHSTTIRGSDKTLKTKRQAAERQRLYRDRKRQVSNNEETFKKRQQAAERQTLYRDRKKKQQQNTTRVTCNTVTDEQVATPPHTEQQEGNPK
jgi:transcription initiation factor TFIIIB Brf1 subunit/transcription initiation factor TFIIB